MRPPGIIARHTSQPHAMRAKPKHFAEPRPPLEKTSPCDLITQQAHQHTSPKTTAAHHSHTPVFETTPPLFAKLYKLHPWPTPLYFTAKPIPPLPQIRQARQTILPPAIFQHNPINTAVFLPPSPLSLSGYRPWVAACKYTAGWVRWLISISERPPSRTVYIQYQHKKQPPRRLTTMRMRMTGKTKISSSPTGDARVDTHVKSTFSRRQSQRVPLPPDNE